METRLLRVRRRGMRNVFGQVWHTHEGAGVLYLPVVADVFN